MKAWRPLKFKSVEEMQKLIEKYFENTTKKKWTITGLAIALNTTRDTLIDYEKKEEFSDTIKKAKTMVEYSYELDLKKRWNSWTIFALKNFGWKDKQEVDYTDTAGLTPEVLKDMSVEELEQLWIKMSK